MATVYINGKFTAQRITGVQRVATNLVLALDRRLADGGDSGARWILLHPPGGRLLPLRRIEPRAVENPGRALHLWEQWQLPLAACDGLLLNLAGSAPARAGAQLCLLHDAAVFDAPAAYTPPFRLWYRFLFRRLARRARSIATVSAFSAARLGAALAMRGTPLVVSNGADHLDAVVADERVLEAHGLREAPYLLAVGSANRNKNMAGLTAAWRYLSEPAGRRLVVCGAADARVFAAGAGIGAGPGIVVLERVSDAELKALYAHAHGLVLPSLYEGFGLPALEAMACGCPVAASNAAALPEVCGDAALLFDARSTEAMAAAMRCLLEEPARRAALRESGRARARQFTWDAAAARLLAHVQALQADGT